MPFPRCCSAEIADVCAAVLEVRTAGAPLSSGKTKSDADLRAWETPALGEEGVGGGSAEDPQPGRDAASRGYEPRDPDSDPGLGYCWERAGI